MTIILPHNYTAREYQKDFFRARKRGVKRAVLVWHRRAGKDVCAWQDMIVQAIKLRGTYYYIFPTFTQGRRVLWDGMTIDGFPFLDYIPKELIRSLNKQEMKILLVNGSIIQVMGSDKYDAIRGTNPLGCVFSEYSWHNPNVWPTVSPILEANRGWATFVYTPCGSNHAKTLYDKACASHDWFAQLLTVDDTNVLSKEDIDRIRSEEQISEDMILQEYYCSFTRGIAGSYFATPLHETREDGRICKVPHDRNSKVHVAFDLGFGDDTVIVWYQMVKNEIHIIDHYENRRQPMEHYIQVLKSKPYIYGDYYLPHDGAAHDLSSGLSPQELARSLGIDFRILPTLELSHEAKVECALSLFNRLWVDDKLVKLIQALENYHSEYDESHGIYKPKPVHDKWSHSAMAFMYACLAIRIQQAPSGPNDEQVEQMRDLFLPRFQR